jgi:NitT/TauT family transport system substrate-binding protein
VARAEAKKDFKVGWSIYVGWMPWGYAMDHGIVEKWADKYGITIEVTQFNDYVESINQYTAGTYDAVTVTNMDALSIPAAGGVDSTAVIVGDFSNGNDAVFVKGGKTLADIKGKPVNLVEFSVSEYLLARALESIGLTEADVKVVNTADPDMLGAFQTPDVQAMVTWNPIVSEIAKLPRGDRGVQLVPDPGRDHGPDGRQHGGGQGQPRFRQGAGGHLV